MIFVTVGTQLPFERLTRTVDAWVGQSGRSDVFAQIGPCGFEPRHMRWSKFVEPAACREHMEKASVIIAHAGMGTILSALELGKPVVVMPRRASLGEHRNEHQLATAGRFRGMGTVTVADDETQLQSVLSKLDQLGAGGRLAAAASPSLLRAIQAFVEGGSLRPDKGGLLDLNTLPAGASSTGVPAGLN